MIIKKRFALYPDVREQECKHTMFSYTGRVPCTGRLACVMCGHTSEEIYRIEKENRKEKAKWN